MIFEGDEKSTKALPKFRLSPVLSKMDEVEKSLSDPMHFAAVSSDGIILRTSFKVRVEVKTMKKSFLESCLPQKKRKASIVEFTIK